LIKEKIRINLKTKIYSDMPYITIDGNKYEFINGETVIQVAHRNSIDIPNFCWHPGLSISGNCRICLVEIEKLPKLAIACSTLAEEGMVVHTKSEKTIEAQNAVMEFLLINHPLDCPICDEAGECKLQDYAYRYGVGESRFDEEKSKKDKRIPLGPNVMFDQERCISCSRCIRYCEEIAKSPQLTFVNRGEKVTIETFPSKELDNPYSMNVIEICPVGALTSRDFRFRARVWDMSFTNSICPGCARGCNTIIGVRNNEILRIEPRENTEVNDWWLCDWGRLNTYKYVNNKDLRIQSPQMRMDIQTKGKTDLIEVEWDEAESKAASILLSVPPDEILFIASPFATMEDNYVLKKTAIEIFRSNDIYYMPFIDTNFGDDILKQNDRTPNSNGLKLLGIKEVDDYVLNKLTNKRYKLFYIIKDDLTRTGIPIEILSEVENSIQHLVVKNNFYNYAKIIFPHSAYAEVNGTFINFKNRIQRLRPAVATLDKERLLGDFSLSRLDKFGAPNDRWTHGLKIDARPSWKIMKLLAKALGYNFAFENSEEVFIEMSESIPSLRGLDYEKIGDRGIQLKL